MLRNNIILILHIPVKVFFALMFSLLLYEKTWGWRIFRRISFLPGIISAVIIGYLFRVMFGFNGPINLLLRAAGLDILAVEWLGNGITAIVVIIICLIWQGIGWQSLLILGGLSAVPPSIFEAAEIDGAGYWRRLIHIVLPMLVRIFEYTFIMNIMWVFTGLFPYIFSLTNGGPGYETTTLDYMIYIKAFVSGNQLGSACALAVILLVIIMSFTKLQMKLADRADDWSG